MTSKYVILHFSSVYLGLDTAQARDNTKENSKSTVDCWTEGPGYSMSKMSWMGKSLRAPARRSKLLDVGIVRLQDWEVVMPEAGPKRIKVKAVFSLLKIVGGSRRH